jgi:hypothetical protein
LVGWRLVSNLWSLSLLTIGKTLVKVWLSTVFSRIASITLDVLTSEMCCFGFAGQSNVEQDSDHHFPSTEGELHNYRIDNE